MSDIMYPMEFGTLIKHILKEHAMHQRIFNVDVLHKDEGRQDLKLFGKKLENPIGPSAGPHTQLAQNIVASYVAGSRFIELKTVQIMYGEELGIPRPCIYSVDEGYNVEWSSEYPTEMALAEYVKAWFACKVVAKEFGLGDPDGFIFNMSVGYNLEGIKSPRVNAFIEGLKNARDTDVFKECKTWLFNNLDLFKNVTAADIENIEPEVSQSISLSTMHGCPASEIEGICAYLIEEKNLNLYLKCNPTLLGYDTCRNLLDSIGYDYVQFDAHQFEVDLKLDDAVPMLKRLQEKAEKLGQVFGVKLTNTFPVSILNNELPGDTMYMSGKALYPLSLNVARVLAERFDGKLKMSYSGGIDLSNVKELFECGVWPITVCTVLLQGLGYATCDKLVKRAAEADYANIPENIDVEKITALTEAVASNPKAHKTEIAKKKRAANPGFPATQSDNYQCRVVCGACVRVCPNRANEIVTVDGKKLIVHIDASCNECGNCACACVEPCQPYKDRITLFMDADALVDSHNQGFYKNGKKWGYRFNGVTGLATADKLPEGLKEIVIAFENEHPYYFD